MKRQLLLLSLLGVFSAGQAAPILNPSNGHYYDYVAGAFTWAAADTAADASSYLGMSGHLVTITSGAENAWIVANLTTSTQPWIGLYQLAGSLEPSGGWTWVTGEALSYVNWAPGEPNNLGGENHAHFWNPGTDGRNWNDLSGNSARGYIVEYQAVPEVTGTALGLVLGALGLAGYRKRSA